MKTFKFYSHEIEALYVKVNENYHQVNGILLFFTSKKET